MILFNPAAIVTAEFDDPCLLDRIYAHFDQDFKPTHLLVTDIGICLKMHMYKHYAFQIRDFGSAEADCLVLCLDSDVDYTNIDGTILQVMELQGHGLPTNNGTTHRLLAQNVIKMKDMTEAVVSYISIPHHNLPGSSA